MGTLKQKLPELAFSCFGLSLTAGLGLTFGEGEHEVVTYVIPYALAGVFLAGFVATLLLSLGQKADPIVFEGLSDCEIFGVGEADRPVHVRNGDGLRIHMDSAGSVSGTALPGEAVGTSADENAVGPRKSEIQVQDYEADGAG